MKTVSYTHLDVYKRQFHAPFAGCLFVSEIIIGTVSMDILAPLLIASCTGFALSLIHI